MRRCCALPSAGPAGGLRSSILNTSQPPVTEGWRHGVGGGECLQLHSLEKVLRIVKGVLIEMSVDADSECDDKAESTALLPSTVCTKCESCGGHLTIQSCVQCATPDTVRYQHSLDGAPVRFQ